MKARPLARAYLSSSVTRFQGLADGSGSGAFMVAGRAGVQGV
jgi:hypothetical protein